MGHIKCIYEGGQGEIIEKKSRFICYVKPVENEEEATAFINEIKKKHWDAKHNCSAFVIGDKTCLTRCSDDGEPAGTAGRPMLEVLINEEICNVCVVVTRYFGGVLLGTGGLVRAYQAAVKEGLSASRIITRTEGILGTVIADYNEVGKLSFVFNQNNIRILDTKYEACVEYTLGVEKEQWGMSVKTVTEATFGKCVLKKDSECVFAELDGEIKVF